MGNVIPFFYFDILARIVPGALTLGALASAGVALPDVWVGLFVGGGAWAAVVGPLVCVGACYVVGLLYEVFFALPGVHFLYNRMITFAYIRAMWHRDKQNAQSWIKRMPEWAKGLQKCLWKSREDYKEDEEKRITLSHCFSCWGVGTNANVFQHAHRFQAEAKMCLHSLFPVLFFIYFVRFDGTWVACEQQEWLFWIGVAAAILLAWGAYVREWRRWLQALAWDSRAALMRNVLIEVV